MLATATPDSWLEAAASRWQELLVDHANCEKKAASTALALLFAYPEDRRLNVALARLAREELRHFEQVQKMMARLGVGHLRLSAGRYAGQLRAKLATHEPQRKIDLLLCGALIEARSCERFERLAPLLAEPLSGFYADLAIAERRHHELYVELAYAASTQSREVVDRRLKDLAEVEGHLATSPDAEFRFHSGAPVADVAA
jgi:tRNA-(ms[2]io[6]A)-hydroxylase